MEALILYSLVITAVGLMLVGTFGAMPLLAEAPSATARSRLAAASLTKGAVAISETRLLVEANLPSMKDRQVAVQTAASTGRPTGSMSETESILVGLHDEVDLLRDEIEGLRSELSALIEVANRPQTAGRAKGRSDVPEPLRSEVNARRQVRGQTRA